jgi:anion-transporting  ArsA/GET3 family ATPase
VVKAFEAQYLRDPLLKQVYSEELTVLPGMDEALALNALRETGRQRRLRRHCL